MKNIAPLTKVQYGIYAECIAHQGEICYNLPYLYILDGSLDEEKLKTAVETAVAAHPTLFTKDNHLHHTLTAVGSSVTMGLKEISPREPRWPSPLSA
jgi:hypothetical protein